MCRGRVWWPDVKTEYDGEPIELLEYVRKNRKNMVLKPSDEYGGKGVTLGWEVEKKEWENAIEQALPGGKAAKSWAAGSCRSASR